MKKLLLAAIAASSFLLIYSCKDDKQPVKAPVNGTASTCCFNYCDPGAGAMSSDVTGVISGEVAALLSNLYNRDNGKNFICQESVITSEEDASSIVFDLATLKRYIAYIEGNVCSNGCKNDSLQLGIRFYYGKYPSYKTMQQTEGLQDVKPEFANRHTLFMIPVFRHLYTNEDYKNFNPVSARLGCNWPYILDSMPPVPLYIINGPTGAESDQNHGSLRPPPSGSGVYPEQ